MKTTTFYLFLGVLCAMSAFCCCCTDVSYEAARLVYKHHHSVTLKLKKKKAAENLLRIRNLTEICKFERFLHACKKNAKKRLARARAESNTWRLDYFSIPAIAYFKTARRRRDSNSHFCITTQDANSVIRATRLHSDMLRNCKQN
jgi:hypothetical protein